MKLYKVKIRLGGNILHEVWKENVTAAELQVLSRIHQGGDNFPLVEVIQTGSVSRSDARERNRLHMAYHEWNLGNGDKMIREVLGAPGVTLPQAYEPPVYDESLNEEFNEQIVELSEEEAIETDVKPTTVLRPQRTRIPRGGLNPENIVQQPSVLD